MVTPEQVTEQLVPSNAFMVIFLPNESYIPTFINNNHLLFSHFMQSNVKYQTAVIYHSMPMSCIMNPQYRQDFMTKFKHAVHVLDCPESNKQEYSRMKGFTLSHIVKQICPLLVPVTEQDMIDNTLENRTLLEQSLGEYNFLHSALGLIVDMYP